MLMTSREIIKRNLEFSYPARIGMNFDNGRMDDIRYALVGDSDSWTRRRWVEGDIEYYDDEWGNIWHRFNNRCAVGEIFKPVLDDWSKLKSYKLPNLADPKRYIKAKEDFAAETERFRYGILPGFPFSICRYMRKMEVYLEDLAMEREQVDQLHEKVADLLEQVIIRFAEAGADGIFFSEDWGLQDRLLVGPSMWREIYKPLYRRLCNTAHRHNLQVLMHSCGYNWLILDDLTEVGVNAFQFDQPHVYDLEKLAQKLREHKVCLFSPVDIQKILPTGNRKLIENEARKMIELFFNQGQGGLIVRNYPDLKGIGILPEWDQWAYEIFSQQMGVCS